MNHKKEYRLFVGADNKTNKIDMERVRSLVGKYFEGATIINATDLWQGTYEESAVIHLLGTAQDSGAVRSLAETLREELQQECVLLLVGDVQEEFI
jgi:hypothetical protein